MIDYTYQINGTYGSEEQDTIVYVVKTNQETWWYCCDGSENVNESSTELEEGCDVEVDTHDIDCFTGIVINSLTQLENVVREHITPETVDRVNFSLDIDGCINSAFQDGNAQDEIVRILKKAIEQIQRNTYLQDKIKDINGNNVGTIYLDIEEEEV